MKLAPESLEWPATLASSGYSTPVCSCRYQFALSQADINNKHTLTVHQKPSKEKERDTCTHIEPFGQFQRSAS